MLYRTTTNRSLHLITAACVTSVAMLTALACSGGDKSGSGAENQSGVGGTSGTGATSGTGGSIAGSGGVAGSGGTAGTGGGGTTVNQDPNSGKWMCTDSTGTHVCQCNDGMDNDNDQATDSADPNCVAGPYTDSEAGSTTGGSGCGTTQCTNCIDDDGDGKIDSGDSECTGALDNDEASYATGISGDNSDACKQDCFFDGNSGSGNDGCLWDLRCDSASPGQYAEKACPYDPDYNNCQDTQSQGCIDYCRNYAPNGCDCFGCCTVFDNDGMPHDVKLSGTCSVDKLNDTTLCPICTKTAACNNPCDLCEYCLGKAPTDPTCFQSQPDAGSPPPDAAPPPVNTCSNGFQTCVPGETNACPAGYYCLTGCCVPNIQ